MLLALGGDPNLMPADTGFGALHMAAMANSIACVTLLAAHGACLDAYATVDDERDTPLAIAVKEGYAGLTAALLAMGANVDCTDAEGNTPLHWCARLGHCTIAKALLLKGADPCAANADGETPAALLAPSDASECAHCIKAAAEARVAAAAAALVEA